MVSFVHATGSNGLARDCAILTRDVFDEYHEAFRAAARRAARHFRARDWTAVRDEAPARLRLYARSVDHAKAQVRRRARDAIGERAFWMAMRDEFARLVDGRPDQEIAETFFSSVTRRHFGTVGVDREIEFQRPWNAEPGARADEAARRWLPASLYGVDALSLARALLAGIGHALADPEGDARRVSEAITSATRAVWGDAPTDGADVLAGLFYRNKGAYLVGCLHRGEHRLPLVLALLSTDDGVVVDAVLTSSDEISIVFGFAWSYFHVDVARPAAVVAFLAGIMPLKRTDELYTSIGYNKHGKTELYRALSHHLTLPDARFEEAPGVKGLVMAVFTLPSLNIVLKIIRDRIGAPKRTTRRHVMEQYHRVFLRDRVGRLADAQLFQGLAFPRHCFSDALLLELRHVAPNAVRVDDTGVVLEHVYTERRVRPLNLFLQEADAPAAEAAVLDYGQSIKDLAAANIFPGDLLLKNFGVSRHGRVIFYDYDELATLTDCHFRRIPTPRSADDELAAEPWFSVGDHDIFPEEFTPFLVPPGHLRDVFLDAHGDLLDARWWCAVQERVRAGELVDTYPYPRERRFAR
jgi:isocitrate dehydrogenase kinase/phosphatase